MTARRLLVGCLFVLSLASPGDARAITNCTIVGTSGVSFGAYDTFSTTALDSAGTLTVNCRGVGAMDQITIDLGKGFASSYAARVLSSGGHFLDYNLYLDALRTLVWGDGTGGSVHYGPVQPPDGTDLTVNLFGRIPAQQRVPAGAYGDTVNLTINF